MSAARLAAQLGGALRAEGLPATPAQCERFARALGLAPAVERTRLYWLARVCFLTAPEQLARFERALARVLDPDLVLETPALQVRVEGARAAPRSFDEWLTPSCGPTAAEPARDAAAASSSPLERLAHRRFDALTADELDALRLLLRRIELAPPLRAVRRTRRAARGARVDLRRTLRRSRSTLGLPIQLARRVRRERARPLLLLCDISGSMAPFARVYLQFLRCAAGAARAEAFAFATRLTRLTPALRERDPDAALERAGRTAPDWSSGTRLGAALAELNRQAARRGWARGAVVVILSDGWERADPALVAREMARLRRSAHRIVWVNPRAADPGFAPTAAGMAAALPWCDALLAGHDLAALHEVARELSDGSRRRQRRRRP